MNSPKPNHSKSSKESRNSIWLLSAYHADSHAAWASRLMEYFDDWDWTLISLPGRHFRWRIRGNPLSWLNSLPEQLPDLILASSMVDLATLKGLHPRLAHIPSLYYFHENQFAYPRSSQQHSSVDPQMVQLYGALAADRIAFNSAFNRDSFLEGVEDLLRQLPDQLHTSVTERLKQRSSLCPVPLQAIKPADKKDPNLILWNHRWEYDKAPDIFTTAMLGLDRQGLDFRLALLGPRAARVPKALQTLRDTLPHRILADGFLPASEYRALLGRAGIVVSTARHEFQGLAIQEAVSAGALPLVPDALCYPEQYPHAYRYEAEQGEALMATLGDWLAGKRPADLAAQLRGTQPNWREWQELLNLTIQCRRTDDDPANDW